MSINLFVGSRRYFLLLFMFVAFQMTAQGSSYAQEPIVPTVSDEDNKTMSVHERLIEITEGLDEPSLKHFYALYGSHNLIQVVESVRDQVSDAIEKCSEANPDMKDALETRYEQWDEAIRPIMSDAVANVENMIAAQDYAKPRNIKKLLKFADKMRKEARESLERFPVTTPEACEYLRAKMDETQQNLTGLLESTLVSLPQTMTRDIAGQEVQEQDEESQQEDVQETQDAEPDSVETQEADSEDL